MSEEGFDFHLSRAKFLLDLAGEPTGRMEILLMAQTQATIALLEKLAEKQGISEPPSAYVWNDFPGLSPRPSGIEPDDLALAFQQMYAVVPDYTTRKIQAIKEFRAASSLGLKEAKDCVDWLERASLSNRQRILGF